MRCLADVPVSLGTDLWSVMSKARGIKSGVAGNNSDKSSKDETDDVSRIWFVVSLYGFDFLGS